VDVLLIAGEWRSRVFIRAQLKEEGYDAAGLGSWDEAELLLLARAVRPRIVVFDVEGEPNPPACLRTLVRLVPPDRVLVLTSSSALPPDEVRGTGVSRVIARPFSVSDVVREVTAMIGPGAGAAGGGPDEAPQ
jgi:DNA-binding response OmpR family regulator